MDLSKFWAKVVKRKPDECWEWTGCLSKPLKGHLGGYGKWSMDGRTEYAHRVSYRVSKGKIPKGSFVCHSCDNPTCVNPNHLWLGTPRDNSIDRDRKGRTNLKSRNVGEANKASRLLESQVAYIKALLNAGFACPEISKWYDTSYSMIFDIKSNRTWKTTEPCVSVFLR